MADDYTAKEAKKVARRGMESLDRATAWVKRARKQCGNIPCPMPEGDFGNIGFKKSKRR